MIRSKSFRSLLAVLSVLVMMTADISLIPVRAYGATVKSPPPMFSTCESGWLPRLYGITKELDFSSSGIDIMMTDSEKDDLLQKADENALKWLVGVAFFDNLLVMPRKNLWYYPEFELPDDYYSMLSKDDWYARFFGCLTSGVDKIVESEESDPEDRRYDLGTLKLIQRIYKEHDTATELIENDDSELRSFVTRNINGNRDANNRLDIPGSIILRAKREELYNEMFSKAFVAKFNDKVSAEFDFDIVPLAGDGSEDEEFGIGDRVGDSNSTSGYVVRGELSKNIRLSSVGFGMRGQFYDAILAEDMQAFQNEELDYDLSFTGLGWDECAEYPFGMNGNSFLPRDLRRIPVHALIQNKAMLRGEDSKLYTAMAGNDSFSYGSAPSNYERYPVYKTGDKYSEYHTTYIHPQSDDWIKYRKPFPFYSTKWGQYSASTAANPFFASDIESDLITDAEFDESGRLLSVSRPVITEDRFDDLYYKLQDSIRDPYSPGITRFKLVESKDSDRRIDSEHIVEENSEEKIFDIVYSEGSKSSSGRYGYYRSPYAHERDVCQMYVFDSKEDAKEFYSVQRDKTMLSYPKTTFTNKVVSAPIEEEDEKKEEQDKKESGSKPSGSSQEKADDKGGSQAAPAAERSAEEAPGSSSVSKAVKVKTPLLLKGVSSKGKKIKLSWTKVKGAEGYDVFLGRCRKDKAAKVASTKGTRKYTSKALKKGAAYKAYVKAFKKVNGKKKYIKKSNAVHLYAGGSSRKYCNPASIRLTTPAKGKLTIRNGSTGTIKASVKKLIKGRTLIGKGHAAKLRFISGDKDIVKVSAKGKVKALKKGTVKVYVLTVNGLRRSVKVTVR